MPNHQRIWSQVHWPPLPTMHRFNDHMLQITVPPVDPTQIAAENFPGCAAMEILIGIISRTTVVFTCLAIMSEVSRAAGCIWA